MVTFINTKGMAFFGPGSEWFWAALQFTALLITFVAIYRQLRIARSASAVAQAAEYRARFDSERMRRHRLRHPRRHPRWKRDPGARRRGCGQLL